MSYHDPLVPAVPRTRAHPELAGVRSVELTPASIRSFDACVIVTDHDTIDYGALIRHVRFALDTRNRLACLISAGANVAAG